ATSADGRANLRRDDDLAARVEWHDLDAWAEGRAPHGSLRVAREVLPAVTRSGQPGELDDPFVRPDLFHEQAQRGELCGHPLPERIGGSWDGGARHLAACPALEHPHTAPARSREDERHGYHAQSTTHPTPFLRAVPGRSRRAPQPIQHGR